MTDRNFFLAHNNMCDMRKRTTVRDFDTSETEFLSTAVGRWRDTKKQLQDKVIIGMELLIQELCRRRETMNTQVIFDSENTSGQMLEEIESVTRARDLLWLSRKQ